MEELGSDSQLANASSDTCAARSGSRVNPPTVVRSGSPCGSVTKSRQKRKWLLRPFPVSWPRRARVKQKNNQRFLWPKIIQSIKNLLVGCCKNSAIALKLSLMAEPLSKKRRQTPTLQS